MPPRLPIQSAAATITSIDNRNEREESKNSWNTAVKGGDVNLKKKKPKRDNSRSRNAKQDKRHGSSTIRAGDNDLLNNNSSGSGMINDSPTAAVNEVEQQMQNNQAMNSMGMGGMMGGYNNMGMGGMMGMGMGMGGMGYNNYNMGMNGGMMGQSSLSNITNMLYGFQQAIFSLSQVVQIVGMNSNALSQMLSSTIQLFDSAYQTISEVHSVHQKIHKQNSALLSEEEKKRLRRLKALRWSLVLALSFSMFKIVHSSIQWLRFGHRKRNSTNRLTHSHPDIPSHSNYGHSANQQLTNYHGGMSPSHYSPSYHASPY